MKGFKEFQECLAINHPATMQHFHQLSAGKINRINARVNFAQSFQGVQAQDYTPQTMTGYNGLFRVFLTYSAFEGFIQLFPSINRYEVEQGFPDYDYTSISQQILSLDRQGRFLDSLHDQLDDKARKMKIRMRAFQQDKAATPLVVSAAIRHVFAHGKLVPNTKDANPKKVGAICVLLSDLMLEIMDTEFEKKVMSFNDHIKQEGLKEQ